ncbi:MAG: hypothetical protein CXT78_07575 [Thaumarchaeota archaeon]|jgi:hypothetical protein|nr:MAG: hypothetical protein CXT78_07575 [Nitrososphaerota archaeon]
MQTKVLISIIIIFVFISFSYGFFSGHYKFFPFEQIQNIKNNFSSTDLDKSQFDKEFIKPDIKSMIQIQNQEDIFSKRQNLTQFIWKNNGYPISKLPTNIIQNFEDSRFEQFSNLNRIDKLVIEMNLGIKSNGYLFIPDLSNKKLIIYQQGHAGDFFLGEKTIQFFLKKGFTVLALSMPLIEPNNQPFVKIEEFGEIKFNSHNYFKFLESENFSPISYFLDPIIISLNYLEQNFKFDSYSIIGISGGGWSTVLISALDERISNSYSVAGSLPIFLRSIPENFGDYEQTNPDLYKITNYLELYILASYGENRKFIQIFNKYDPCCFSGELYKTYEIEIKEIMSELKGEFFIHLDDSHKEHKISENALKLIDKLYL